MTPPKDRVFLADIGYGFYVATIWNEVNQGYVYAMQADDNDYAILKQQKKGKK